ncbi:MAG: sodium:calcium antiporter, partial [Chloroflexota bacterium]
MLNVALLISGLGVILLGAELFTNGIEWVGHKLNFAEGVIGSILAAVGTALPETLIPFVAILSGSGSSGQEIGIGAILGAPFMLSTLAMFVSGAAVLAFAHRRDGSSILQVNRIVLSRDLRFFLLAYAIAIGAAFVPWRPAKLLIAALLALLYLVYVYLHMRDEAGEGQDISPLHFHRAAESPHIHVVNLQVLAGLACILAGANFFVRGVESLADASGVPPLVLALVLAPIATELPEKFNSVLWIRKGKD